MNETQVTQLGEANAALVRISPNITAKDRAAASKYFGLTPTTISKYFNNKGRNLDTATKLFGFFRKRVDARQNNISAESAKNNKQI